jgi:hypothetical protein
MNWLCWSAPARIIPGNRARSALDNSFAEGVFGLRKVAATTAPNVEFRRAMIYDPADGGGVYLFLFRSLADGPCDADYWYEDVAGADRHAAQALGAATLDWQPIPDPRAGCQDDRVAPVRVVRSADGFPVFGQFERLPE